MTPRPLAGARYQAAWAGDQGSELVALLQQQPDAGDIGYNATLPADLPQPAAPTRRFDLPVISEDSDHHASGP